MNIPVLQSLRRIARSIVASNRTEEQWAEVESDDMFQEGPFVGGFDADEGEFCFSYFGPEGELWFQLSLREITGIAGGQSPVVEGREAE